MSSKQNKQAFDGQDDYDEFADDFEDTAGDIITEAKKSKKDVGETSVDGDELSEHASEEEVEKKPKAKAGGRKLTSKQPPEPKRDLSFYADMANSLNNWAKKLGNTINSEVTKVVTEPEIYDQITKSIDRAIKKLLKDTTGFGPEDVAKSVKGGQKRKVVKPPQTFDYDDARVIKIKQDKEEYYVLEQYPSVKHGEWVKYDNTDTERQTGVYYKGMKHGLFTTFTVNHIISGTVQYVNNTKHGKQEKRDTKTSEAPNKEIIWWDDGYLHTILSRDDTGSEWNMTKYMHHASKKPGYKTTGTTVTVSEEEAEEYKPEDLTPDSEVGKNKRAKTKKTSIKTDTTGTNKRTSLKSRGKLVGSSKKTKAAEIDEEEDEEEPKETKKASSKKPTRTVIPAKETPKKAAAKTKAKTPTNSKQPAKKTPVKEEAEDDIDEGDLEFEELGDSIEEPKSAQQPKQNDQQSEKEKEKEKKPDTKQTPQKTDEKKPEQPQKTDEKK